MSGVDERIALVLSWQISDVEVLQGKSIRSVSEQSESALIIAFTDGTWARFVVEGWDRNGVAITDEPPDSDELVLAGLISRADHQAILLINERDRIAQREAGERREFERLKQKFGAE